MASFQDNELRFSELWKQAGGQSASAHGYRCEKKDRTTTLTEIDGNGKRRVVEAPDGTMELFLEDGGSAFLRDTSGTVRSAATKKAVGSIRGGFIGILPPTGPPRVFEYENVPEACVFGMFFPHVPLQVKEPSTDK